MKVELLIAYEDRTWDTATFELPNGETAVSELIEGLLEKPQYKRAVGMYVYGWPAQEEV